MPNWCYSRIKFTGDYKAVRKLYNFITEQFDIPFEREPMHFDKNIFLGTFLERAELDSEKFRCRGQITDWPGPPEPCDDDSGNCEIVIYTETAWCPMIAMWLAIIEKISPSVQLFYASEECGMGIYQSNDPEYVDNYVVDTWAGSQDTIPAEVRGTMFGEEFFEDEISEDRLRDELLKVFPNGSDDSTNDLIKRLNDLDFGDDNGTSVHKWEYYSASEQD